jgi:hypothetical protein
MEPLYRKAAEQGAPEAQVALGWMYAAGVGAQRDPKKAAELYQQAADRGNAAAQASLALLYATGEGVAKDEQKAAELYERAKAHGASASESDRTFLQSLEKEATAPEAGAAAAVASAASGADAIGGAIGALDPNLVGAWEAGGKSTPHANRLHWQIGKNGQYSVSGPDTDSGAVTGIDGHLRQLSTDGNAWVELAYAVRGETLLTYGPQGLTEWHKTSSQPSADRKRVVTRNHSAPPKKGGIGSSIKHFFGFK